jgi:hypothetical protein
MSNLRIECLEAAMRPDRLYPVLTSEGYGFYAGRAGGNRQLLAAVDGHVLLALVFDVSGELRETHWHDLSPTEGAGEFLRVHFGWEPALVRVKRFRIPLRAGRPHDPIQAALVGEEGFAIAPVPLGWQSSLDDPESLGTGQDDFAAMVQGWVDCGNFALYWGNEYYLDSEGTVVGS